MMARQRGFTLLLLLLALVLFVTSLYLTAREGTGQRIERAIAGPRAVAAAREALVAYALAGGSNHRPGALPCPDTNGDGSSDGTSCQGGTHYLGRLPHGTLDINPDNTYGSDEIWYVVDHDFADWDPHGTKDVNTGSPANLVVNGTGGFPAALILAGDPVAGQDARSDDPGDHLEDANADGDMSFASCETDTCNDRVVGVTRAELLDLVRTRLLGEIRDALEGFHDARGFYPWAAPLGHPDGDCSTGVERGTLPVAEGDCGADHLDSGEDADELPEWIENNDWHSYVYYAAASPCTSPGTGCDAGAAGLLSLAGDGGQAVVYGTAGEPIVSNAKGALQDRGGSVPHDVIEYLDSVENTDGDEDFDDPPDGAGENDRLRALAAP